LVNRAAQQMLRVEPSATGRPYLEVIRHPDIAAQLTAALHGEEIGGQELTLARDPGRTLLTRAAPVTGPSGGAVLVLHDITDLRRADQIRRDFVANVSHELRTPLTAIRGYVEALLDGPSDAESTRKFLEIIARHSTRMERLVKDLLRLARLDARQELLETARCDIKQIFSAVTADLAPSIEAKQQRVTLDRLVRGTTDRRRSREASRHRPQPGGERRQLLTRGRRSASRRDAARWHVHDHGRRLWPWYPC
jgi:two-component system phosphate regulon sensor histidine kinase PhoR